MALADNAAPFHCCVCGDRHRWGLCARCRAAYMQPDGSLPAWLRFLRADVNRQKKRLLRQLALLEHPELAQRPNADQAAWEISLEQLLAQGGASLIHRDRTPAQKVRTAHAD